jgi:hypothetical protein
VVDFNELQRAADLSSAAYSDCQGSAFGVAITLEVSDAETDTKVREIRAGRCSWDALTVQGFVGHDDTLGRISVVMRGTTTLENLLNDLDITPVTPSLSGVDFPAGAEVMQGLQSTWGSVHDEVIAEVGRLIGLYPNYTLESVGHSLGGALTYMSYIALAQNFPDKSITSNAMAAYPIGNQVFADFGQSQNGCLRRGNEYDDGVPVSTPKEKSSGRRPS